MFSEIFNRLKRFAEGRFLNRVYILPTAAGLWFFFVLFVIFSAGAVLANDLALLLVILLTGLMFAALIRTHYNLAGVRVGAVQAPGAFAGGTLTFHVTLENASRREAVGIAVKLPRSFGSSAVAGEAPAVARGAKAVCAVSFPTSIRGVYGLPTLKLTTLHPSGLFRSWLWTRPAGEYCVYPKPCGGLPWPRGEASGEGRKPSGGGGEDFQGHRRYEPGDSLRHVDWKAYAKGGDLLTKVFRDEARLRLTFSWEDVRGVTGIEARLSQICEWLVRAARHGLNFGLTMPGGRLAPAGGGEHLHRCLRILAGHPAGEGPSS